MNMLFDALVAPLETRSDAVLIRPDDTQVTGEQLFALSGQIANVLRDAGVEPGHRVAMQCEKSVEALALYLACLRVGSLFLPLNTAYMPAEMDYFVGDAEPTVVVSSSRRRIKWPRYAQIITPPCSRWAKAQMGR